MSRADVLKLLAAAGGLAVVVALITPPTRPVPAPAGDWRKQIPVKTGTPAPAASTASVPAAALLRRPPPPPTESEQPAEAAIPDQPSQPATSPQSEDRVLPGDSGEQRYRQGYHWAQRNGIDDGRDCVGQPGDPFVDGCLAALRDGDDDRGSGSPWSDPRGRRYGWDR